MTLEQSILEAIRTLPQEKQRELLEHAKQLVQTGGAKKPRKNGKGLWADLKVSVSAEDIDEVRREMWENFPREGF